MRCLTVSAILALLVCSLADATAASDLRLRGVKAPPAAAPYAWSGPYVGFNIGYANATALDPTLGGVPGTGQDIDGFFAGGLIGMNWQAGRIVYGLEADVQASAQRHDIPIGATTVSASIPWFGTLRGRLGYATHNLLVYATAGIAVLDVRQTATIAGISANAEEPKRAFAAGLGVEAPITPDWAGRLDYLYVDAGDIGTELAGLPYSERLRANILRLGVARRF